MARVFRNSKKCVACDLKSQAVQMLSEKEIQLLEQGCLDVNLAPGEKILIEGMPHSFVIYIREGYVKIHMIGPRGNDQILKIAKSGAFIGIQTILGGDVNDYSVTALMEVEACYINVQIFKKLIKINSAFSREILTYVCKEELNYFRRFVDQQQKQINGRLADAILYLARDIFRKNSFQLLFTHADLAALIGSTRESVSRALKNLKEGGIIKLSDSELEIVKPELLEKISKSG